VEKVGRVEAKGRGEEDGKEKKGREKRQEKSLGEKNESGTTEG
jgi:hypothetical protein